MYVAGSSRNSSVDTSLQRDNHHTQVRQATCPGPKGVNINYIATETVVLRIITGLKGLCVTRVSYKDTATDSQDWKAE